MNIHINSTNQDDMQTLIIGVPEHMNQLKDIVYHEQSLIDDLNVLKKNHIIQGAIGKLATSIIYIQQQPKRLVTVGLGNVKELTYADYLIIWGNVFQFLKQEHITEAELLLTSFLSPHIEEDVVTKTLGLQSEQAIYQFDNYKSDKRAPYQPDLYVNVDRDLEKIETNIQEGRTIGEAINLAREFSQIPPNLLTPQYFAELVLQRFKDSSVKVDIKDGQSIQSEGFGLIHAVGKGSMHEPRVITMRYEGGRNNEKPIVLVGKGITYDSGGYSIKSKTGMQTMKFDMCGAANVVAMIEVARQLALPINIIGIIASAENMINDKAMKPDDVYTALSGETVEVLNTDAEGRLVLGDAVAYATQFQPQVILDFATLTGAAIVALGEDKAAAFESNAREQLNTILTISKTVDEQVFELPITNTERQLIKNSDVADLVNHTNGQGKALFAASFISHFSGSVPHLHFDIAGPATTNKMSHKGPKGPTGYMIPTIVEWLKSL
ncbi:MULTISPECIES: leucyl aminopeptidase family protein [Staphylococcus]|jgi:leucyl aminopeptidase|uniref:Probable cytosol aminopeptidase n=2 Tax=Staphylococcus TaxID=1279 RepID=A0A364UQK5_STAWA|nr:MULTISPECIES: leucyl aminopeptidase family protein [Staphylococcus]PAK73457.1 aminopeptidase [Staphylococcus pasteuri]SKR86533.1 leucyl aminopeptidase [Mycobacteroides abscessus subsp. abscessus]AGC91119.1 cytosol aminopeptidase [Staphylococcus warneri SG1]EGG96196.1 cytosol aminopeptidase family, catalytic domain protein [Staphylococcus warneri VCU121]KEK47526.1 cytosol aminopeptidase family, catalytic domain protein [Staphylococcus warneri Lyso 1 2011]